MSHAGLVNGVFGTVGTVLVSAAVLSVRRNAARAPGRTAVTASLGVLGVSFLVQSPAARGVQNEVLVNLGQLTGNGTTLIAAYALQVMVLHILYERAVATAKARRWLAVLLVTLVAMTALFLITPTTPDRFTSPDAPGGILAYYLIYAGYLGATATSLFLLIRRYAAGTFDRWLRISLRLQQWACVTAMIYLAGRIGALVVGRIGIDMQNNDRFGLVEFVVAAVIPAVGVLFSTTGIVVKAGGRRWDYRLAYRRLRPLWEAAREAQPHMVLPVPSGWGGTRLHLYRRIIEIQDAQLAADHRVDAALRRQIDDAVDDAALTVEAAHAVRKAAIFAAGLAALQEDRTSVGDSTAPAARADENLDLTAVVHQLKRVSDAYIGSPIVRRFASTASDPAPH